MLQAAQRRMPAAFCAAKSFHVNLSLIRPSAATLGGDATTAITAHRSRRIQPGCERQGQSAGNTMRRQPGWQLKRKEVPTSGSPSRFTGIVPGVRTFSQATRIRVTYSPSLSPGAPADQGPGYLLNV